jgi:hypothetical protein
MMNTRYALMIALLAAGPACAEEPASEFSRMDQDGNGMLDRQEAQVDPNLQVYFGRADTDADGGISSTEYQIFVADLARAQGQEEVPAE